MAKHFQTRREARSWRGHGDRVRPHGSQSQGERWLCPELVAKSLHSAAIRGSRWAVFIADGGKVQAVLCGRGLASSEIATFQELARQLGMHSERHRQITSLS